jgi:uncharacterized protein YlaN (UPF0358 family)
MKLQIVEDASNRLLLGIETLIEQTNGQQILATLSQTLSWIHLRQTTK